jgi:hypothetical protein
MRDKLIPINPRHSDERREEESLYFFPGANT